MAVKAGGGLFGPDLRRWPAWWADAMEVLVAERSHANNLLGIKD
jgi:hypothetical protein